MALVNPYCSVQDVRDQLTDAAANADLGQIEKAINATSRAVDKWCGRRFWTDPAPVARTYRPGACGEAAIDDVSTTTGLVVETDPSLNGSWSATWTIGADFELGPENADADGGAYAWSELTAIGSKVFPVSRRRTLRVTARFGWSAIPDQVTEAAVLKATGLFKRKDAPFGVAGFGDFGAVRITRKDPDVIDLLDPFQRALV